MGAFLSANGFQTSAGIENFRDSKRSAPKAWRPTRSSSTRPPTSCAKKAARAAVYDGLHGGQPFPVGFQLPPVLTPGWKPLGNEPQVDEYLRRQEISRRDYADLQGKAYAQFPGEKFLIVRFGDHQPSIASPLMDPGSTSRRSRAASRRAIRASSRRITRSTRSTTNPPIFRPRWIRWMPLSAAGRAGSRWRPARPELRRTEEDLPALRRRVLSLPRRRRGAALQPPADRRRVDQGDVGPAPCALRVAGR